MESLERVIGSSSDHFVRIFMTQFGFSQERAEQFVSLAGDDLIASYEFLAPHLDPGGLSAPENVRDLLSAIHASRIASSLGISPSEVWTGLRVFVPGVLQFADGRLPSGTA
ncbi:MAG TPA: hypothetical protein VLA09_10515 [Longimicrobiales bacterium]|nr:hypothetical protein [Longimicrobiales bacterium]